MRPLLPGAAQLRVIYATKELSEQIESGLGDGEHLLSVRIGYLHNDLDRFICGELITVGYGREKTCFMKALDPRGDEVWELRSRDPRPSYRIFGSFAACDLFIATHMVEREHLGGWGSLSWSHEIRRCKALRRQLFGPYPPHSGGDIHDYISDNVVEVGNLR
jgi:hypothetical protein